jgi:DNA invertase Pin-like site-specific DNA recombinase
MFDAAENKQISIVLVWALDRFSREGISETFSHIQKLLRFGCQFYSLTEEHFRTTGPTGELMIAVAAWIAKQERTRISERTKAGLALARARGSVSGRKPKDKPEARILELKASGMSLGDIAKDVGLSKATIARVCGYIQPRDRVA